MRHNEVKRSQIFDEILNGALDFVSTPNKLNLMIWQKSYALTKQESIGN